MQTYFDSDTRRAYARFDLRNIEKLRKPQLFCSKKLFLYFLSWNTHERCVYKHIVMTNPSFHRDTAAYIRETANLLAFIKKNRVAQSAHLPVESLTRLLEGMKKYPLRATKKDFSPIRSPTAGGELWPCEPHEITAARWQCGYVLFFFYFHRARS